MKVRIIAVVLGLAAAGLGVAWWRAQDANRVLTAEATKLSRRNAELNFELKQATRQAADVRQRAVELDSQLGSAKTRTTTTESRQFQLTRELNETKSQLTEREQREVTLMAELATLRQKVADTGPSAAVAVAAPGVAAEPVAPPPPVDLSAYNHRIAELEQQLTALLTRALAEPAPLPPAPHQVVRVGPHDAFVILDCGREHGARANDIISVRRGTSEVARVQISDARPRFSVAQVLPGTLKGQLQTGDLVVLTN